MSPPPSKHTPVSFLEEHTDGRTPRLDSSTSSLDINDAIFCEHGKEVCNDCNFDAREGEFAFPYSLPLFHHPPLTLNILPENDSFFGVRTHTLLLPLLER